MSTTKIPSTKMSVDRVNTSSNEGTVVAELFNPPDQTFHTFNLRDITPLHQEYYTNSTGGAPAETRRVSRRRVHYRSTSSHTPTPAPSPSTSPNHSPESQQENILESPPFHTATREEREFAIHYPVPVSLTTYNSSQTILLDERVAFNRRERVPAVRVRTSSFNEFMTSNSRQDQDRRVWRDGMPRQRREEEFEERYREFTARHLTLNFLNYV